MARFYDTVKHGLDLVACRICSGITLQENGLWLVTCNDESIKHLIDGLGAIRRYGCHNLIELAMGILECLESTRDNGGRDNGSE